MRHNDFKNWMETCTNLKQRPIADALSRVKRIEHSLRLDLDLEYIKDSGNYVLSMLDYSTADAMNNRKPPIGLEFKPGANIRNGMASLKAAAKQYFNFCHDTVSHKSH